jgi:hypothetical protein
MDKILLLLIGLLLVFMFISFNQHCKFVENRANNNIDKKEDFNYSPGYSGSYQYEALTSCPVCFELKGGVCEPRKCSLNRRCLMKNTKGIKAGTCVR